MKHAASHLIVAVLAFALGAGIVGYFFLRPERASGAYQAEQAATAERKAEEYRIELERTLAIYRDAMAGLDRARRESTNLSANLGRAAKEIGNLKNRNRELTEELDRLASIELELAGGTRESKELVERIRTLAQGALRDIRELQEREAGGSR